MGGSPPNFDVGDGFCAKEHGFRFRSAIQALLDEVKIENFTNFDFWFIDSCYDPRKETAPKEEQFALLLQNVGGAGCGADNNSHV